MKKLLLLLLCCILSLTAWSIAPHVPRISSISGTYTSTQTLFPFLGNHNLHALAISGSVTLNSDTSLVRVIMHDINGKSYLLYEASPMLINGYFERFAGANEETEWMCGVVPQDLKIVVKDATCTITGLTATQYNADNHPLRAPAQRDSIRIRQVQAKVDKINAYNEANGLLWRAGVTELALRSYDQRPNDLKVTDDDNSLEGFDYYIGGVYEVGKRALTASSGPDFSLFVDHFDWRNVHKTNWNTDIKDQELYGEETYYCWAFTGAAAVESYVNLYFNRLINLDLSEEDIAANSGARQDTGGASRRTWMNQVINYVSLTGIGLESDFPLHTPQEGMSTHQRDSSFFAIKVQSGRKIFDSEEVDKNSIDSIKYHLIHHGPLMGGVFANQNAKEPNSHAMLLVGYGVLKAGDSFSYKGIINNEPFITIPENSKYIGRTYWIFKDSYARQRSPLKPDGYLNVLFRENEAMLTPSFLMGEVTYINTNDTIQQLLVQNVEDRDGDGYYTWGINRPKTTMLPSWVPNEQDGDDSDYTKCTMDEYGFLQDLVYSPNDTIYIDSDQTFCGLKHLYRPIKVQNHATLTIASNILGHGEASIVLAEGSHLDISDGSLESVSIIGKESSVINLRENSRLNISRSNSNSVSLWRTQ